MNIPFISIDELTKFESDSSSATQQTELIVKYNGNIRKVAEELGGEAELLSSNYAIINVQLNRVSELYNYKEIEYIELPKKLPFFINNNLNYACITEVQRPSGFGLSGKGVAVGIADSGIDYTHPDFINDDGTSRILFLWDQTISGIPPAGFKDGTEYTDRQLNTALNSGQPYAVVPSRDIIGHGTAVAGIAAGNGRASPEKRNKGAAFEASIIAVKLGKSDVEGFTRTTDVMRAIKYISDKSEALNMPCAINLSYGTNNGSHDGSSLFETFIDSMSEKWKTVISAATGNEGSAGHHFFAKIKQNQTVNADFVTDGSANKVYLTLWKNFNDSITFELISPSGKSTGVIRPVETITRITLDNVQVSVLYAQPTNYRTNQEVYFLLNGKDRPIPSGVWKLIAKGEKIVDGAFDIWLPTIEDVSSKTAFLLADTELTMTLPSTSKNVISVAGYDAYTNICSDFSGRGSLRRNFFIKPDITAPAVNIVSAKAGGGYDSFTGTSMAAPFVTGSAALMMQWGIVQENDLFLYGQRVKAFLQKGADRKFPIEYPSVLWGWGTLSLCNTMNILTDYT